MPSPGLDPRPAAAVRARAFATTAASSAGYTVPVFYDSMIAKLVAWARIAPRGDRAHGARAARIPGARHPHDDPVLPVADAAAGVPRRDGTTRRTSIGCSPSARGQSFTELDAERRKSSRRSAAAIDAWLRASARSARRRGRPALAGQPWTAHGARARRCADDVRGRGRRPHPQRRRSSRQVAGRFRVTVDGVEHFVDAPESASSALSLIVDGDAAASREAQVVPGSARRRDCSSGSTAGRSPPPSTAGGVRRGRAEGGSARRRRADGRRADAGPGGARARAPGDDGRRPPGRWSSSKR